MDSLVLSRDNFVFIWTISTMFSLSECEPFIFWNLFKVNVLKKIPYDFVSFYSLFVRVEGVTDVINKSIIITWWKQKAKRTPCRIKNSYLGFFSGPHHIPSSVAMGFIYLFESSTEEILICNRRVLISVFLQWIFHS